VKAEVGWLLSPAPLKPIKIKIMKNSKNYNRKANKFYNDIMEYFGENVFYEDEEEREAFETAMKGVLKDIK
jgi:hypothetical protein